MNDARFPLMEIIALASIRKGNEVSEKELECSECKATYHHTIQCSLRDVPLPVWPMLTTPEAKELLAKQQSALISRLTEGVEGLTRWTGYTPDVNGEGISRTQVLALIAVITP